MGLNSIYTFRKINNTFYNNKFGNQVNKIADDTELFESFQHFCKEYNTYVNSVLKNKKYSERELADYIFENNFRTLKQYQESLKRQLYASLLYLNHYRDKITKEKISRYCKLLSIITIDSERIVAEVEVNYLKKIKEISLNSGRTNVKKVSDIFHVAKTLFFIDDIEKTDDIYAFDIRPYAIFPIRQLIEIYGKEIIGLISIEDEKGNFSKKHLSSAWDFIKDELLKGESSRIKIPFDINIILKIQKWSNRFIHTTIDAPYYIIFSAIRMMFPLFQTQIKGLRNGIKTYDGRLHHKAGIADIKIENYNSLKISFEEYININPKKPEKPYNYKAIWEKNSEVSSYIISL